MTVLPRGVPVPSRSRNHHRLELRVGPVTIAFETDDPATHFSLSESHEPFLVQSAVADCAMRCRVASIAPRADPPTASCSRWDLWRLADDEEEIVFRGPGGVPDWWLRTDRDFASGELVQRPTDPPIPIRADGHPVLEYLVVRLLGQRGGLLLHASTAILDDKAYVFVGHSGAGKSTMAAIAEAAGARIPTDDRTLFTIDDAGIWAWGTPWHGSLERKSPERAQTAGIYLLEQSSENSAVSLPSDQGVMELFVRLVQPRLASREVRNTLSALQAIAARVPLFRLRFSRSAQAFETAVAAVRRKWLSSPGEGSMAPFLQPVPKK